ncbi:MAG TPA: ATP-binding protein [Myxococcaceae bacterium]|nr:ATP-binding protein [Myxococcaceae bacterium]
MSGELGTLEPDERRLHSLRKLTEVSRALTYAVSREEVLRLAVERAAELLNAQKAALMLVDDHGVLLVRASHGIPPEAAIRFAESLSEALSSRIHELFGDAAASFLGVPLVVGGNVTGILAVGGRAEGNAEDEWLLSALADQAAVGLEKTRLDEAAAFRERFIGIVGHDLRNPLSAIRAAAGMLLLSDDISERDIRLVRRIASSVSRMAHIIDQLLDLTRARLGGGITVERESTDIHEVCRGVLEEISLAHPDATVRFDPRAEGVGTWDAQRLAQVVSNLLANAIQHGAASPIELRSRNEGEDLVLEVHNQGAPIPPDLLPHVFDPFRTTQRPSRSSAGVGLGLFITQEIVHAHGGTISARSSTEEGTTFTVRLPRS